MWCQQVIIKSILEIQQITAMHGFPVAEKNSPALHVLVSSCSCLMESIIKGILGNTYEFRCAKKTLSQLLNPTVPDSSPMIPGAARGPYRLCPKVGEFRRYVDPLRHAAGGVCILRGGSSYKITKGDPNLHSYKNDLVTCNHWVPKNNYLTFVGMELQLYTT